MPHMTGAGQDWDNPSERPRVGRRFTVRWTDAKGNRRSATTHIDELGFDGGVSLTLGPAGNVR